MAQAGNIFEELQVAKQVGGLSTSMQHPDVDQEVPERAIEGQAAPDEVVLRLHDGASYRVDRGWAAKVQTRGTGHVAAAFR